MQKKIYIKKKENRLNRWMLPDGIVYHGEKAIFYVNFIQLQELP